MNFYKHFMGDYARDTKGLSLIEHGAYRVLLDHVYATEQMLPDALPELYRIAGAMTPAERKAVEKVAAQFFPVNGDGRRHNKRAEEELGKHRLQVEHNRVVGHLGGRPRKKPGNNQSGIPDETRKVTRTEPGDNPSHSQKPEKTKTSTADAVEGRDAVATVADCPHQKLIALYHEILPDCPRVEKLTAARQQVIRARWRDEAKPNRENHRGYSTEEQGLAYWRRFFGYVAQSRFLTGKAPGRDGKPPFVATLKWLVTDENFAKVIEGQYHRD
jgi:uncharacterized protein YdaU (DUF1376 family)